MKRMEISQNDSADAWISVSVQIVFIRLLGTLSMDGCLWVPILSIENARKIVTCNPVLAHKIDLRLQKDNRRIFDGIIAPDEYFDVTICNPPFHSSKEEAEEGTLRKLSSLKGEKVKKTKLNFGGNANELWCEGGELHFLLNMISESRKYRKNCGWFTSLVSKEKNLDKLYAKLKAVHVSEYKIIRMCQGTKNSRILAWRFLE